MQAAGQLRNEIPLHTLEEGDGLEPHRLPEIVSPYGYRAQPEIAAFGEWDTTNLGDRAIHESVQRFFSGCGWRVSSYGFGSLAPVPADAPRRDVSSVVHHARRNLAIGMMPAVRHVLRGIRQDYRMMGLLPRLRRVQAILVGGGALLSADAGPHFPRSLALLATAASRLGKPLYCLGCGAEGLWTAASERNILNFLAACTVIAPRDAVSAERIAAVLRRPVPVFGDFCLPEAATPAAGRGMRARQGLAINVFRLPARWSAAQERYEDAIVALANRLMRSLGGRSLKTVTIFTTGALGDTVPAQRVCSRLAGSKAELLFPRNLDQLSGMLGSSVLVVASRLHGAILALAAGALVVGFSPTPKLQNFFATIGIGDYSFSPDDGAQFVHTLDSAGYEVVLEGQRAALACAPVWACKEDIRRQFRAASGADSAPSGGDDRCK